VAVGADDAQPIRPVEDDRYQFHWQEKRDEYAEFGDKLYHVKGGCDTTVPKWQADMGCTGPHEMAALALDHHYGKGDGARVLIDRGAADGINTDWEAGLFDDSDRLVSDWGKVTNVMGPHRAEIELEMPYSKSTKYRHVGMTLDRNLQEQHMPKLRPDCKECRNR